MDLSAVIFVALAVAWAVYLVPKALKHHDELARTRSVDKFSVTMRTLGRRDAVPTTAGRAVVTPGRPAAGTQVTVKPRAGTVMTQAPVELTPAQRRARRAAAQLAAKRRRRVLGVLLLAVVLAAAPATVGLSSWWITAVPGGLIVAWLVTCRLTVRSERARAAAPVEVAEPELDEGVPTSYDVLRTEEGFAEVSPAAETSTIDAADADPSLWAPRPVTLPTYLGKDMAPMRQYVLTKDDSGVWSAGHDTSDSLLAQEVRDHESADAQVDSEGRAVGS